KRRGGGARAGRLPAPAAALEGEAHAAAAVVASGGHFRCTLPDRIERPRCWGEAGHYYTVYFILLAVRLSNPTPPQLAFYAQLPDEVQELDAVHLGSKYFKAQLGIGLPDSIKQLSRQINSITGMAWGVTGPKELTREKDRLYREYLQGLECHVKTVHM